MKLVMTKPVGLELYDAMNNIGYKDDKDYSYNEDGDIFFKKSILQDVRVKEIINKLCMRRK